VKRPAGVWGEIPPVLGMRCWQKDVPDGHLTVLLAKEDGCWHMSISHRRDSKSGPVPGRNPRWDEIKEARYRFCPGDVTMAMHLPPLDEYVNVHETTFHLWELP
jgi:hypothetical protein